MSTEGLVWVSTEGLDALASSDILGAEVRTEGQFTLISFFQAI